MVWCLSPVHPFPGSHTYYIFSAGTYTVGRKGCDITVQADIGISREHAKIVVDAMTSLGSLQQMSTGFLTDVIIKDTSRYGTYVNKEVGSKKVKDLPDSQTRLKIGDILSFGTANFRLSYVPLVFFIHASEQTQAKYYLQETVSSIGACATHKWNSQCTHVIADEFSSITDNLIDAISEKTPVVHTNWIKVLAEKIIRNELPSCSLYSVNLKIEGETVKVVGPEVRERCLDGHTFVLGPTHQYKFGVKLQLLLKACSGRVLTVSEFCSGSVISPDGASDTVLLVNPPGSVKEFDCSRQLSSLSRVDEMKLVAATLSGHLDPSNILSPSILVSSSNSTDETIVADSDVEVDTVTSNQVALASQSEGIKHGEISRDNVSMMPEKMNVSTVMMSNATVIERRIRDDEPETSEHQSSDVFYSPDLIVRDLVSLTVPQSEPKLKEVNFKCFRKREIPSGNGFRDLIPFSKDPYKESDYDTDVREFIREEKKRKKMEAVAEDLFNSEKVKKRRSANTSIRSFLTHA
ncbi:nibrin homolog [Aristolochia californica]|uniref:nibrin homolog n=1 Tax=Aristolochia californica TaxID=171875 RepID=UPI0035D9E67D